MDVEKLLQQLALAKEAGADAEAKDFFAPAPGSGGADDESGEPDGDEPDGDEMGDGGGMAHMKMEGQAELTPEQLQELLSMLSSQGGGQ